MECQLVLGQTLAEEECEAESLLGEGLAEVGMRNLGRHLCWAEKGLGRLGLRSLGILGLRSLGSCCCLHED